jgi:hypothetical protein
MPAAREKALYLPLSPGAQGLSRNLLPGIAAALQVPAQALALQAPLLAPLREGVAPPDHLALPVAIDLTTAAAARASVSPPATSPNPAAVTAVTAPVIIAVAPPLALHRLVDPTLVPNRQVAETLLLPCAFSPRMCLPGTTSPPLELLSLTDLSWRGPFALGE